MRKVLSNEKSLVHRVTYTQDYRHIPFHQACCKHTFKEKVDNKKKYIGDQLCKGAAISPKCDMRIPPSYDKQSTHVDMCVCDHPTNLTINQWLVRSCSGHHITCVWGSYHRTKPRRQDWTTTMCLVPYKMKHAQ